MTQVHKLQDQLRQFRRNLPGEAVVGERHHPVSDFEKEPEMRFASKEISEKLGREGSQAGRLPESSLQLFERSMTLRVLIWDKKWGIWPERLVNLI